MEHGDFRVGDALGKGFSIWIRNLPSFLILAILVYSPILIYTGVFLSGDLDGEQFMTWSYVIAVLGIPIDLVVTAAVLYGVIQQLRGEHAGIGQSIGVGIKRLLPVIGVGLLSALAVVGGFILLIVPGVILLCMFYVAVPAAVAERPGVMGALKRSRELTSGYKGSIFGILLILGVLGFVVNKLVQSVFLGDDATMSDLKTFVWITLGIEIAMSALQSTVNAVVYHDLRVAKDGVATEDLARVFE
jgi:hypothetical protein